MTRISVTIGTSGNVSVEVNGMVGQGCEALTRPLEDALGTGGDRDRKPEYFAAESQGQTQVQQ